MKISASLVQELRQRTGAGMMECKKALTETSGDLDKAFDLMRQTGAAKADKKANRITAEGIISIEINADNNCGVIVEINCETDFVARDENFKQFVAKVTQIALMKKINNMQNLAQMPYDDAGQTIEDARNSLIAQVGENISLRRIELLDISEGYLGQYIHGGRIGVLIHINNLVSADVLAKDIAMHIAASNPQVINIDQYPADKLAKEKEIFLAKSKESGKPEEIVEKMVAGQVAKFLNEVALIGQPFVKNPDQTIGQLLKENNAEVKYFVRFELGEGIEKITTDFVAEVMGQVQRS